MKNLNYVLVVFMLLLMGCGTENVSPTNNTNNIYQLYAGPLLAETAAGKKYNITPGIEFREVSFDVGTVSEDNRVVIKIDGYDYPAYAVIDYREIPYGTYTANSRGGGDDFLENSTMVISKEGVTINGAATINYVTAIEFTHEGEVYIGELMDYELPRVMYAIEFSLKSDRYLKYFALDLTKQD
jgi:hypothetical protein